MRLAAAREMVRERPADDGGQDDRDADEPDDEHDERTEAFDDLAARGPRRAAWVVVGMVILLW